VPRNCDIFKHDFDRLHYFYDSICPDCAAFNWAKRHQTTDLGSRFALLTGGRVKIGCHVAPKKLQADANVIETTRFPIDTAKHFLGEKDSRESCHRWQL